ILVLATAGEAFGAADPGVETCQEFFASAGMAKEGIPKVCLDENTSESFKNPEFIGCVQVYRTGFHDLLLGMQLCDSEEIMEAAKDSAFLGCVKAYATVRFDLSQASVTCSNPIYRGSSKEKGFQECLNTLALMTLAKNKLPIFCSKEPVREGVQD